MSSDGFLRLFQLPSEAGEFVVQFGPGSVGTAALFLGELNLDSHLAVFVEEVVADLFNVPELSLRAFEFDDQLLIAFLDVLILSLEIFALILQASIQCFQIRMIGALLVQLLMLLHAQGLQHGRVSQHGLCELLFHLRQILFQSRSLR